MPRGLKIVGQAALLAFAALIALDAWMSRGGALRDRPADAVRVATWNVHYIRLNRAEGPWSVSDWEARRAAVDAAFKALDADILSFQEMESFAGGNSDEVNLARSWLLENNPGYAAAAVGDWRDFPSTQPVLYRRGRFEVLDQGWFFFSETPERIYSRSFDGSYPAFASWARFRARRTGAVFRVLNVHLDYRSRGNRLRSAELLAGRIRGWTEAGEAVILAGDLNAVRGSRLHRMLGEAGLSFLPVRGATFHFDRGIDLLPAIDHVAHTQNVAPLGPPMVLRQRFAGDWPSDHYPVAADLALPGAGRRGLTPRP